MTPRRFGIARYVDTIFACLVIAACVFTVITTMTSSSRRQTSNRKRNADALRQERESFLLSFFRRSKVANPENVITKPAEVDSYPDHTKEWFSRNPVTKFIPKGPHPNLTKPIIANPHICNSTEVDILIYFHSLWSHFEHRRILRESWANKNVFADIKVRTIFILGKPPKKEDQLKINNENVNTGDIVQGNFEDTHKNLSLKSIQVMQWINDNCLQAKYIVKADDDMFVNIFALTEFLVSQIYNKKKVIMCSLKENQTSIIVRDPKNKWYVPDYIFKGQQHYPTFCSGYTVLFSSDLVPELYKYSFTSPYFSVDDAYLFGMLLGHIKDVHYEDISNALSLNLQTGLEEYKGSGPLMHVGVLAWDNGGIEKLWQATLSKMTQWTKKHANIAMVQEAMRNAMEEHLH
ncbi:beta-1,3-galactosyltransferase 1-like isoform X1 [Ostrea edulis]|uniref:beta-1,3-galactosyltransferase 1-like isoform X1 n=1 Tax=Ostrea edulis TaxID=37623 RepID=UPI002094F161|nr:beta-1,3-galactosyltransferase 1-like isoform X1 [Ostrea edulis]XP_048778014.1 beta-1,3-galactosyltransferase 1-like isoform X1 [Ostrea edulis]XP_048778015.1 beta-1,3-galactosyltransferase 1-like isoform X1 [Ostrea edulis]XP_056010650.1 beta-1,3-galactosyltransferase 1-like isoform X1 [Ostrea edulis]XP_056010651.1 beta-1,3-galactosyltransferase 1-like isoform X1 [Ostrea edulis]